MTTCNYEKNFAPGVDYQQVDVGANRYEHERACANHGNCGDYSDGRKRDFFFQEHPNGHKICGFFKTALSEDSHLVHDSNISGDICVDPGPTIVLQSKKGGHNFCGLSGDRLICGPTADNFTIESRPNHKYALKANGKYCTDSPSGIVCNKDKIHGTAELFTLGTRLNQPPADVVFGQEVGIKGGRAGKFCAVEDGRVICNSGNYNSWEKFVIADDRGHFLGD